MEIGINIIASTNSGRFRIGQEGQYSYLPKGAKIIWLSEPISLVADDNIIYEVNNYNDIPVVTELSRSIGGQWKLMLSYITDMEKEENNISFSIRDGFFNDIVTKLELLNVLNQGYKNIYNDSDNFKSNKLRQIFMRQESKEDYSYNKVKGFEKEEANKKFDDMIKKSLYIFFDSTENCYKLKNAENLSLKDIEQYNSMDVYIVNEEFTWTYVLTHEDGWLGPFFYAI